MWQDHCAIQEKKVKVQCMHPEIAPTCAPQPRPTEAIADGADHVPSNRRATAKPVPILYATTAPNLATVKIAKPLAPLRTAEGIDLSGFSLATCHDYKVRS